MLKKVLFRFQQNQVLSANLQVRNLAMWDYFQGKKPEDEKVVEKKEPAEPEQPKIMVMDSEDQ